MLEKIFNDIEIYFDEASIIQAAKSLIKTGDSINVRNQYGQTLLFLAAQTGHHRAVKFLIKSGADVNARDLTGCTALHLVTQDKAIVEMLLKAGADVNVKDAFGYTVLHRALSNKATMKLLFEAGANTEIRGIVGYKVLPFAVEDSEIVETLIKAGADVEARTLESMTPLYVAAHVLSYASLFQSEYINPLKKNFQLLIDKGADLGAKAPSGQAPLDLCPGELLKELYQQTRATYPGFALGNDKIIDIFLRNRVKWFNFYQAVYSNTSGTQTTSDFQDNEDNATGLASLTPRLSAELKEMIILQKMIQEDVADCFTTSGDEGCLLSLFHRYFAERNARKLVQSEGAALATTTPISFKRSP